MGIAWLRDLNLVQQFALAGSIVVLIAMTVVGRWVASQIETGVVNATSATTALYMDALLAPNIPELISPDPVDKDARDKIASFMKVTAFGQKVLSIKIWKRGGIIAYANTPELIGKRFQPTTNLQRAWAGTVSAEFDSLHDAEDAHERAIGLPLLEMYMPVRERSTGKVIAVAEFYILAETLRADLSTATVRSWLLVAAVSMAMMAALFGIVLSGNHTIEHQRESLKVQVNQLTELLDENRKLSNHLSHARRRATHINERFLRRIGADLHDGPAQLIGHALLRVDMLRPEGKEAGTEKTAGHVEAIEASLREALADIRRQSAGLSLAELDNTNITETIELAVARHCKHTGTSVTTDIQTGDANCPRELRVGIYRFVQECLTNAFRHADAKDQTVSARTNSSKLTVEVSDGGPGIPEHKQNEANHGIGLAAMRDRVDTLGGTFTVQHRNGAESGTRLTLEFDLSKTEPDHV